jgi:hypothetical protein
MLALQNGWYLQRQEMLFWRYAETVAIDMSEMTLVEQLLGNYTVDYDSHLTFLDKKYADFHSLVNNDDTQRSDLGGVERRQWADFKDINRSVSRVIVEFKARPTPEHHWHTPQSVMEEANALVRTLCVTATKSDTSHILFVMDGTRNPTTSALSINSRQAHKTVNVKVSATFSSTPTIKLSWLAISKTASNSPKR